MDFVLVKDDSFAYTMKLINTIIIVELFLYGCNFCECQTTKYKNASDHDRSSIHGLVHLNSETIYILNLYILFITVFREPVYPKSFVIYFFIVQFVLTI